jgi:hypothetical protein
MEISKPQRYDIVRDRIVHQVLKYPGGGTFRFSWFSPLLPVQDYLFWLFINEGSVPCLFNTGDSRFSIF